MRAACTVAACNSLYSARNPRRAFFFGHGLGCTFAKALFCRRRRRASGAFEGLPALKPVFDRPYACTVRQLGPQGRKERKRAGNLFRKWLRRRGQSIPRGGALTGAEFSRRRARSARPGCVGAPAMRGQCAAATNVARFGAGKGKRRAANCFLRRLNAAIALPGRSLRPCFAGVDDTAIDGVMRRGGA